MRSGANARAHARAQEGTVVECAPTVPSTNSTAAPARVAPQDIVWAERVAGGNYTHKVLDRGTAVSLIDVQQLNNIKLVQRQCVAVKNAEWIGSVLNSSS